MLLVVMEIQIGWCYPYDDAHTFLGKFRIARFAYVLSFILPLLVRMFLLAGMACYVDLSFIYARVPKRRSIY